MKKGTLLGLTAILTAAAAVAMGLLVRRADEGSAPGKAEEPAGTVDADKTIAFPLKDKYADYSRGTDDPIYILTLDTPDGAKEVVATKTQYETYYIGDEVVCLETDRGPEIL